MARAIAKITSFDYVLQADRERPAGEQTHFTLAPLTGIQYMRAMDLATRNRADSVEYTLHRGLRGWTNFKAGDQDLKFEDRLPESNLVHLCMEDAIELANAIHEASNLTEADRKN